MFKICTKCNKEKPVTDFNIRKSGSEKRQSHCRLCRIIEKREYRKTELGKLITHLQYLKLKHFNPEKRKARKALYRAIKSGRLPRKCCSVCGENKTEAHHLNYDEPLNVLWLCRKHHRELHCNQLTIINI